MADEGKPPPAALTARKRMLYSVPFDRPSMTKGDAIDAGSRGVHVAPPLIEYSKLVSAVPPPASGCVKATETCPSPDRATRFNGADGTPEA